MPAIFVFLALMTCAASGSEALLIDHHPGPDWRLHPQARMATDAGYLTWHDGWSVARARAGHLQDGAIRHATILMPTWAELEPEPGHYAWPLLDQAIAQVTAAPGCGFLLAPVAFAPSYPYWDRDRPQRDGIPDWVELDTGLGHTGTGSVAYWGNPPAMAHLARFLSALGERYQHHPRLVGVFMGFLDPYHGEAVWRGGRPALDAAESDWGLTPAALEAYGRAWIDAWVAAFPDRVDRLAWPGSSRFDFWAPGPRMDAYRDVMQRLWDYAYAQGCGGRDGGVESWNRFVDGGTGQTWTADGHLVIDPAFAPIAEGRLWYTENEVWSALDEAPEDWRHLIPGAWYASCLRTLQMRRSWMAIGPRWYERLEAIDPPFLRWVEHGLGQTAITTTDAWCWLREGYRPHESGDTGALKNIERWLIQRDHPGAMSEPAARIELGPAANHWSISRDHEFHARIPAAGSDRLILHLDDALGSAFWGGGITVVVQYHGADHSGFALRYAGPATIAETGDFIAEAEGLHSAIWRLPDFTDRNALSGGGDLAIVAAAGGMPPIAFVRVLASPDCRPAVSRDPTAP